MHAIAILALALTLFFGALGCAKVLALPPMRRRAAHLGLSVTAYRGIGVLELAGAAGLLLGLAVRPLGGLAAVGLLLLLAGALVAHLRSRDRVQEMTPALVSAVLVALYLGLLVGAS
jgi:hypothetical protein